MSTTLDFLTELEGIIRSRRAADAESSYTKTLFDRGTPYIAQKVGEEGVELAIAATQNKKPDVVNEAADLIYHMIVLLRSQDVALDDVLAELKRRHQ